MWDDPWRRSSEQSHYTQAAVCRRGHVETSSIEGHEVPPRCPTCGASVLIACPSCAGRIRGYYYVPGVIGFSNYDPPEFCDACGAPFPWANRQARLWQIENLLDEQEISEADRLTLREQLEALRSPDIPEEEQQERWARIKKLAPGLIGTGQQIIVTVVSATIQKQLGI
jgi:hypothetical protein